MKSGIYRILNTFNGKQYIGQAQLFLVRWRQHRTDLNCGKHANRHLQAAWKKYGSGSFVFEIILESPIEALDDEENAAMAAVPAHLLYNLGTCAVPAARGIKRTPEFCARVSQTSAERWLDPKFRQHHSEAMRALWADPTEKQRLLEAMKNGDEEGRRAKISEHSRKMMNDPGFKSKWTLTHSSEKSRQRMSDAGKINATETWKNPTVRESRINGVLANQKHWNDPRYRARQKAGSGTPGARAKKSAAMKEIWARRKAAARDRAAAMPV